MKQETHTPPLEIEGFGKGTKARWSLKPDGKLIVLVHGFMGEAMSTWAGLPEQLCLHKEVSGCDVVQYGYESVTLTAEASANDLQTFLTKLFAQTTQVVNRSIDEYDPALRRVEGWKYQKVVLAGHSLGACVVRRATLNHLRSGKGEWPEMKMIWFAPAHRGAIAFRLLPAVALGLPGLVALAMPATYLAPVLKDLKENSPFLKELLKHTEELCGGHPQLNAPVTFWARKDKVVVNGPFARDRSPAIDIKGVTHVSICKPGRHDVRMRRLLEELK